MSTSKLKGVEVSTYDGVVSKVTDSKCIPPGQIRALDNTLLKMFFVGMHVKDIAKKMEMQPDDVRIKLNSPAVQRELRRLDKRAESELVRIRTASEREFILASLKAVKILILIMKEGVEINKIKAAVKIIEYTHGKPTQKVTLNAKVGEELSDEEESELEEGLEDDEKSSAQS